MTDYSNVNEENLNSVMEFDHVIRVHADGNVTDATESPYMELSEVQGDDGTWEEFVSLPDGWELMRGYSGQHGYSGPFMHSSEFIGGRMARDILETPGDYVALTVSAVCNYGEDTDCNEEDGCTCEGDSWAVAFKPANDHGYMSLSKFDRARDDILHFLCVSYWGNASFGDVESPTGYVWRISNDWEEVKPENMEFSSVLEDWLGDNEEVTDSPALRRELVGHFLVTEDSNGLVFVEEFPTETALKNRFDHLEECFNSWNEEEEA